MARVFARWPGGRLYKTPALADRAALPLLGWPRAGALTDMDLVRLARVAGASPGRIILRHLCPNVVNTLLVLSTLEIGSAVITEASLSFLGLGVPRPLPSWGTMLAESQTYVFTAWWLPLLPGLAITLLVTSSNLVGDWLRDRLDPTKRQL